MLIVDQALDHGRSSLQLRRELRHDIGVLGRYRNGRGIAMVVQVLDLSEHGCRFRRGWARLETRDFITLTIGSIGPINAHVAWTKSTMVGVKFDEKLHPSVLNHIITEMDKRPEAESPEVDSLTTELGSLSPA